MTRLASVVALSFVVTLAAAVVPAGVGAGRAYAQTGPRERPAYKGTRYRLKIDSSPQQAVVYWDAGATPAPKDFGIAGYTPITLRVPKGAVKVIVELRGFKTQERALNVRKHQDIFLPMEKAAQPGRLDLRAGGDRSAEGAEAYIDGVMRGTIPNIFELLAGRHQLEVRKPGYRTATDWVEIGEDERRTRDISLEKAEAPGGTLLVTAEGGGEVWVDGVRKDVAPAMVPGLSPGEHVVEVRKEGLPPWRQSVLIVSGQQVKVSANLEQVGGAALRVLSNETDVMVFVDGEEKGRAPLTVRDIRPGQHIIEGRKAKFKGTPQNVKVVAGEQAVVELRLEPAAPDRPRAILKVQSTVPNAEVFVDGSSLGRAPVERTDLDPGKHYVVVHRDGYTDFKREVVLIEGQPVALVADLSATGGVRILSTPEGADVRIDGELVGKTPLQRDGVGAGDHVIELRLKAYFDHKETIKIEGGREKLFSVDLKILPTGPSPEQVQRRKQGMSSFGAKVNPVGGFTADIGAGYPYYLTVRLTVGAFAVKPMGLDLGVEFQTFPWMANGSVHGRLQLAEAGPLSAAVRANLGAGFGSAGRDTRFADLSAIASLAFSDIASVFLSGRLSWWSDKFCPNAVQVQNGIDPDDFCKDGMWPVIFDKNPNTERFSDTRIYMGIGASAAIDRLISVYFQLEFLPLASFSSYTPRLAFRDQVNEAMAEKDTLVYGSAGLTLKF